MFDKLEIYFAMLPCAAMYASDLVVACISHICSAVVEGKGTLKIASPRPEPCLQVIESLATILNAKLQSCFGHRDDGPKAIASEQYSPVGQ